MDGKRLGTNEESENIVCICRIEAGGRVKGNMETNRSARRIVPVWYKCITRTGIEIGVETDESDLGPSLRIGKHLGGANNVWDTAHAHLEYTKI